MGLAGQLLGVCIGQNLWFKNVILGLNFIIVYLGRRKPKVRFPIRMPDPVQVRITFWCKEFNFMSMF